MARRGPTIDQQKGLEIAALLIQGMARVDVAKQIGVGVSPLDDHITNMRRMTYAPSYEDLSSVARRYIQKFGGS